MVTFSFEFFQMNEKAGPSLMTTVAMPVFSTKNETVCGCVTVVDSKYCVWHDIHLNCVILKLLFI